MRGLSAAPLNRREVVLMPKGKGEPPKKGGKC